MVVCLSVVSSFFLTTSWPFVSQFLVFLATSFKLSVDGLLKCLG